MESKRWRGGGGESSREDHVHLRWGSTRRYRCQNPQPQPESNNKAKAAPDPPRRSLLIRIPVKPTDDKQQQHHHQEQEQAPPPPPPEPHWNLRSRAAAAAAAKKKKKLVSSSASAAAAAAAAAAEEEKQTIFSFTLSKEEIEADFLSITGSKPPPRRSANRRPRTVQNEIDNLSPGIFLPENVDANRYRVSKSSPQY